VLFSRLIFIFLTSFIFWSSPQALAVPRAQADYYFDPDHQLQAGDKIKVTIYPIDEHLKGGEMQVSPDGNITFPLIGKYSIAGKTVLEASRELVKIINADYLVDPEVVIETLAVRHTSVAVSVLGSVKQPGNYDVVTKSKYVTLLQAILYAGGFSDVANIKKIKIIREANGETKSIHVNAEHIINGDKRDVKLEEDDIVHVGESFF